MLTQRYPKLSTRNIADSRYTLFEKQVMQHTKGHGCDIILNSINKDKTQASLRCLAKRGRFLNLESNAFVDNNSFGMALLMKNVSVHGIMLDALFQSSQKVWDKVRALMLNGIENGVVRPVPTTVFGKHQVEDAFRYLEDGKQFGKVLIKVR